MKWMKQACCACLGAMLAACAAKGGDSPAAAAPATAERIGIYDSRAVAVAFAGSAKHEALISAERKAFDEAKAQGDAAKAAQCEQRVKGMQERMHRQGFGTAPVTDILAFYPEGIGAIKQSRGVSDIVSRWDESALKLHPGAEQVDVTEDLIALPAPDDRQLRWAREIQKKKPLTDAQVEQAIKQEAI